jgi:hypothetical protein
MELTTYPFIMTIARMEGTKPAKHPLISWRTLGKIYLYITSQSYT